MINLEDLKSAITDKTILICLMAANNETGIINPITAVELEADEASPAIRGDPTAHLHRSGLVAESLPERRPDDTGCGRGDLVLYDVRLPLRRSRGLGFGVFGLLCCLAVIGAVVLVIVLISRNRKRR